MTGQLERLQFAALNDNLLLLASMARFLKCHRHGLIRP